MFSYNEIIQTKYPGASPAIFGESDGNFLLQDRGMGDDLEIVLWDLPDPQPTLEELDQWAAEHQEELLKPHINEAIARLQELFYEIAGQVTGEPGLDVLKIEQWKTKYEVALAWAATGKPDPTSEPAYSLAVSEAANRVDQYNEPTALLEVWLANGAKWKRMMSLYVPFEAAIRAAIRSATSAEEIQTIRNGLEIALKQLFGLH